MLLEMKKAKKDKETEHQEGFKKNKETEHRVTFVNLTVPVCRRAPSFRMKTHQGP